MIHGYRPYASAAAKLTVELAPEFKEAVVAAAHQDEVSVSDFVRTALMDSLAVPDLLELALNWASARDAYERAKHGGNETPALAALYFDLDARFRAALSRARRVRGAS